MRAEPGHAILGALTLLAALLAPPPAAAHEFHEHKRVLISVSPTTLEMLVAYELPAGARAQTTRALIDADGDGRITREVEKLAQAQTLLPRVQRGLKIQVGGKPLPLTLSRADLRDGPPTGERTGFVGLILYTGPLQLTAEPTLVELLADSPDQDVTVEMQVTEGARIHRTDLPRRGDAPVAGPIHLGAQGRAFVWVAIDPNPAPAAPRVPPAPAPPAKPPTTKQPTTK